MSWLVAFNGSKIMLASTKKGQQKSDSLESGQREVGRFSINVGAIHTAQPVFHVPRSLALGDSSVLPKLTITPPGDMYEQEADRVAASVVEQINAPASSQNSKPATVQRQKEDDDRLMMKPAIGMIQRQEWHEEELMPKRGGSGKGGKVSSSLQSDINRERGKGVPLGGNIRASMEQAFGTDFSGVRVHTNSNADRLNRSIHARAFTTGKDIFFRQGAYEPASRQGQELIAHELTHVVQQQGLHKGQNVILQPDRDENVDGHESGKRK